ncbi:hypothetical protein RE432_18365 [Pusillimonas sp. SM2304]|uniref:hypothetical protein n=1 Tax=Pusillimonas sp. SM2304 TaxID=3073241 RepID=UPI0028755280|nr:hypothetical protein [Pusillimonas sp. SM2304]MDS1142402.1 hypothetical protein [Pusillimonas sp. SM2304]
MSNPQNAAIEKNQTNSRRGGARPGAGRKPGSATKKTREIADKAAKDGITPLEVMLEAMISFRDAGELDRAASIAKDAAPYVHPRLAAIEHSGKDGGPLVVQVVRFGDDPTTE